MIPDRYGRRTCDTPCGSFLPSFRFGVFSIRSVLDSPLKTGSLLAGCSENSAHSTLTGQFHCFRGALSGSG